MPQSATGPERFAPLPETASTEPAKAELEVLELWRAERTFQKLQDSRAKAPPFVFWEGPPTANGRPGIHHVLARTLKDIVCRFQAMLGHRVERKAGWDTHGLPVELEVEKALGISGKPQIEQFGVAAFNQKCRESVWKYREEWERLSERTAYWLDYEHPYVTYESSYVDSLWYLLARFHREGLVYRGKRVLPYCGRCGTGLSSHELGQPGVYRDVNDPSVIVRCRGTLRAPHGQPDDGGSPELQVDFLVWTTTPWTLPSNVAVAVHPNERYLIARQLKKAPGQSGEVDSSSPLVCVAEARAAAVLGDESEGFFERYAPFRDGLNGDQLTQRAASYVPLFDVAVPRVDPGAWDPVDFDAASRRRVVTASYVTVDDGTGLVHQAPAYGVDDWNTAQRKLLPVLQAVGAEGRFLCDVGPVKAGTFFKDPDHGADDALTNDLKTRGLLFRKTKELHSYPHCWRCSTPLFYFASPAWYIRTTALKQRMLDHNARVQWVPDELRKRFGEWLENNVDWNISRDRYWGTPLPFWVCEGCNQEVAIEGAAELRVRAGGLPDDFDHHKPFVDRVTFPCETCGGVMKRTSAVVDVWFDSGAMPFAQYGWPHAPGSREKVRDQFPASYICEGLDQTRGWFYTLHAIGAFVSSLPDAGLPDGPAFETCLVNGLVLDKDGVKMSKRLGNVVDPWKVIDEHGSDAVRWYLIASAAPWLPKKFDPKALAEVRGGFMRALINSYQFFREYARLDGFEPTSKSIPAVAERAEIDRWLSSRTQSVIARVRERALAYDFTEATRSIERFVTDELSNWYIRRNRRRFWRGETGADKLAAFATLFEALRATAHAIAPFAPFTAELLWRRLEPDAGSVHAQRFPEPRVDRIDRDLEESMRVVQRVVVMGRALREKVGIKVRQPLRALHLRSSDGEALRLLATPFAREQVLEELNVKTWGSLAADDGKLCRLTAKANFRVLGKRIGARMKAAAAAISALDPESLQRLRAGNTVPIAVDGDALEVGPDDVLISVESQAPFEVETDGRFVLWLDTELDDALMAEGLAREVVTQVNALRKQRGLAIDDRISLTLWAEDPSVRHVFGEIRGPLGHWDYIAAETLALDRRFADAPLVGDDVARLDLGDGRWLDCVLGTP